MIHNCDGRQFGGCNTRVDFVIVESPFATNHITLPDGSTFNALEETNILYARACVRDCLTRGEAPFASHLLYTQEGILDDHVPEERRLGIEAGLELGRQARRRVFYVDRGFSRGMLMALDFAAELQQPCELRRLDGIWHTGWGSGLSLQEMAAAMRK